MPPMAARPRSILVPTLLATVLLAGCQGDRLEIRAEPRAARGSSPIVGGSIDNGHPSVVLIYNSYLGFVCTGSVVDDYVVLTAAHCVDDSNENHYQVAGGTDPFNDADWVVDVAEVAEHPDYDDSTLEHDVGIIVLQESPPVTPLAWQKTVNNSVYAEGTSFTAVGYGVTSESGSDDSGIKRTVQLTITDVGYDAFLYGSASKNICSGDSGGPSLKTIGGVETVIGTVSYGDQNCNEFGGSMRTDDNAEFIGSFTGYVPPPTPTPDGPGDDDDDNTGGDDDDDVANGGDGDEDGSGFADYFTCGVTPPAPARGSATGPLAAAAALLSSLVAVTAARRRRAVR